MGEAVDRLEAKVELARVYVPAYIRMLDGKPVKVDGYWRKLRRRKRVARGEGTALQRQVDELLGSKRISDSTIDSFLDRLHRADYAPLLMLLGAEPEEEYLPNRAALRRLLRTIAGLEDGGNVTEMHDGFGRTRVIGHGGSARTNSRNAPSGVA